ncbi:MAG: hypothetical protein IJ468_02225 [Lachnospiraceae bacterium]|nr:hypothetical protein [Lachnospiraceae bacterium]
MTEKTGIGTRKKEWYLDQVTGQISGIIERRQVRMELEDHLSELAEEKMGKGMEEQLAWKEAVEEMGNPDEQARLLGEIHCYDSWGGYYWAIEILWIGLLVQFFPLEVPIATAMIGKLIVFYTLTRLKGIGEDWKRAWKTLAFVLVLDGFGASVAALPWEWIRRMGEVAVPVISNVAVLLLIRSLAQAVIGLLDSEDGERAEVLSWIEQGWISLLTAAFVIASFQGKERLEIQLEGGFSFFFAVGFAVAVLIVQIYLLKESYHVKHLLQEKDEIGIEPFTKKRWIPWLAAGIGLALTPFLFSIIVSFWPVKRVPWEQPGELEQVKAEQLMQRLVYETEGEGSSGTEPLQEEMLTEIMTMLPAKEKEILQRAEEIRLVCEMDENASAVWQLLFLAPLEDEKESGTYRIGSITIREAPFDSCCAAESFWVSQWETIETDSRLEEELRTQVPFNRVADDDQQFLLYEANGTWYRFWEREAFSFEQVLSIQYTLPQDADWICCYQAMTVAMVGWNPGNFLVGIEQGTQNGWFRIPYANFEYPTAPGSSGGCAEWVIAFHLEQYWNTRNRQLAEHWKLNEFHSWFPVGAAEMDQLENGG